MNRQKNKKFLKKPRLGDEKGLLKKIIKENLQYPHKAIENKVEGDVIITYKVNNLGEVFDCKVVKGIGYGCDEEAIRLVKTLLYEAVNNRGVKVITSNRIKIPFRLSSIKAKNKVSITYTPKKKETSNNQKEQNSFNYSIPIK